MMIIVIINMELFSVDTRHENSKGERPSRRYTDSRSDYRPNRVSF